MCYHMECHRGGRKVICEGLSQIFQLGFLFCNIDGMYECQGVGICGHFHPYICVCMLSVISVLEL